MIEIKIPENSGMIRATIQYLSELDAKLTDGGLFATSVKTSVGEASVEYSGVFPAIEVPRIKEDTPVELDADGKEWDERIHASTRTKTQDGRWKMKRGVDKARIDEVAEEGKPDITPMQNSESTPPPPVEPTVEEGATPPPPPPSEPTTKEWSFVTLVEAITANKIPLEKAQEVAANWGVTRFPMLNTEQYAPLCANIAADLGLV